MDDLIDIEVDGLLANYGQVLLTMEKPKVERNLIKMGPLREYILNERNKKRNMIVAVASMCDYIVFYEEQVNLGCCMYFMPYFTPRDVAADILQDEDLMDYFVKVAQTISGQQNCPFELRFHSKSGIVLNIHRNQLN